MEACMRRIRTLFVHICRLYQVEVVFRDRMGKRLAGRQAGRQCRQKARMVNGRWQMANVIRSESMRYSKLSCGHVRYNSVFFGNNSGRKVCLPVCVCAGWCVKVICDILTAFWLSLVFATYTHAQVPTGLANGPC